MKLKSIEVSGVSTAFEKPIIVPFHKIPRGLVAICGNNGKGKTMLTESGLVYALYGVLPSRKSSIYTYLTNKNSEIATKFTLDYVPAIVAHQIENNNQNEYLYEITHRLNLPSKKHESYLKINGVDIIKGNSKYFDEFIERHLMPYEIFMSTVFTSQNKEGTISTLKASARKELLNKILALEQYGRYNSICKTNITRYNAISEANTQQIIGLVSDSEYTKRINDLNENLKLSLEQVELETKAFNGMISDIAIKKEELNKCEQRFKEYDELKDKLNKISEKEKELTEKRVKFDEMIVSKREGVKKSKDGYIKQISEKEEKLKNKASIEAQYQEYQRVKDENDKFEQEVSKLDSRISSILELVGGKERQISAQQELIVDSNKRISKLETEQTQSVPCGTQYLDSCPYLTSRKEVKNEIIDLTSRIEKSNQLINQENTNIKTLNEEYTNKQNQINSLKAEQKEVAEKLKSYLTNLEYEYQDVQSIPEKIELLKKALKEVDGKEEELEKSIQDGETRYLEKVEENKQSRIETEKKIKELGVSDTEDGRKNIEKQITLLESVKEEKDKRIKQYNKQIEDIRFEIKNLEKQVSDRIKYEKERQGAIVELSEWQLLEKTTGKNGIQALELDAICPVWSQYVNQLLKECYGGRFNIEFQTLKESATDKTKMLEDMGIRVIDGLDGKEKDLEDFSGGEGGILSEAISLGLCLYYRDRLGDKGKYETLIRDETTGPLHEEHAIEYINMLSKALEMGNFHHILFISHLKETWKMADASINLDKRTEGNGVEINIK